MSGLAQIIAENPTWPAIQGEGPWAGLPAALQPVFKEMEDQIYVGSLSWWINLVALGAIGYNLLWSFPSDVRLVWWPEFQRCFLQSSPVYPRAEDGSHVAGGRTDTCHSVRPASTWKVPRPIILCHFLARVIVFPYFGSVINYYRLPKSCNAALHGTLLLIGIAAVNGQAILTLRCQAISRHMPGHRILWLFLWGINVFLLVLWFVFSFTTNIAISMPAPLPMGFRVGFRCGLATDVKWIGITIYAVSFLQDTIIFFVSVLAASGSASITPSGRFGQSHFSTFFKTLWGGVQSAGRRMIAGPESPDNQGPSSSSSVSKTFIMDSIRAVLMSWLLEVVGAGFNIAYTLALVKADTTRTSWVLPLHAIISMIVCPALLNSSRSATYGGSRTGWTGHNSSSGIRRSKSNALQGISVLSTVQRHTEKADEPGLLNSSNRGQEPFRSYNPPIVVEDINTFPLSSLGPPAMHSPAMKDHKDDDSDIRGAALSPGVRTDSHQSEPSRRNDYPLHSGDAAVVSSAEQLSFHHEALN